MQGEQIAHVELIGISKAGERAPVNIHVFAPVEIDELEWQCFVEVRGLKRVSARGNVSGGDSLQALCLGLWSVAANLTSFVQGGGRLHFLPERNEDGVMVEYDWPVASYFGKFGESPPGLLPK